MRFFHAHNILSEHVSEVGHQIALHLNTVNQLIMQTIIDIPKFDPERLRLFSDYLRVFAEANHDVLTMELNIRHDIIELGCDENSDRVVCQGNKTITLTLQEHRDREYWIRKNREQDAEAAIFKKVMPKAPPSETKLTYIP